MTATRQQHFLALALDHVTAVDDSEGHKSPAADIYGGLCHSFPVLVRSAGLCQALAFMKAKATGNDARATAYRYLCAHVAAQLGIADPARLLDAVRGDGGGSVVTYMRQTRTILQAWVYYKRFARSVLDIESAQAAEEEVGS